MSTLRDTLRTFVDGAVKMMKGPLRYVLYTLIFGILVYQLWEIGFVDLLNSVPNNPMVYVLAIVLFFVLPVAEHFTYGRFFDFRISESIPMLIKKRVYNKNLMSYVGEFDFYLWLTQKAPEKSKRRAFDIVKDNNIISSVASIVLVSALLLVLFFFHYGGEGVGDYLLILGYVFGYILLLIAVVVVMARTNIYSLSMRDTWYLTSVHSIRILFISAVQILQWYLAISDITVWELFVILSVHMVISRIPILPAKDLIFISGSIELTNYLDISTSELAAIMVLNSLIDKILSGGSFYFISKVEGKTSHRI
jgi:hypothetical protein